MSYIQVDSRGCGAGKTHKTIIPRIQQNIKLEMKTLLVVPSLDLQEQYRTYFTPGCANYIVGLNPTQILVINSKQDQRISEQLETAQALVVCITHQGFLQNEHKFKDNVDLIIDEAFDPYSQVVFNTHNARGDCLVDLNSVIAWKFPEVVPQEKPTESVQPFFELAVDESRTSDLLNDKFRKLQNPNLRVWSLWETYNSLVNKTPQTTTLYLEYDARRLLSGWSSVWIAAAALERTFMGAWLLQAELGNIEVVWAFEPHSAKNLTVHRPQEDFSLSKSFVKEDQGRVENIFRKYVNQTRTGKLFYNTNNDSTLAFAGGQRISHNAHGLNGYSTHTDYAFASAIKPDNVYRSFLTQRSELTSKQIDFAMSGYTAYQLLMRSALRVNNNTQQVNAYFLDTELLDGVLELFDNHYEVEFIPGIEQIKRQAGRPKNNNPLTSTERSQVTRLRKKYGLGKDITAREVLDKYLGKKI